MSSHIFSGVDKQEGLLTSGSNLSYWIDSVEPMIFSPLNEDLTTETAIIGGGIAGLSVAYCLAKAGRPVVLIDDGFIGSGESGRTTAHIVNALDDRYSEIENRLGKEASALAAESHTAAIDFIEKVVAEEKIDCDFRRIDGYLFLHPSDKEQTLKDELDATRRAGIQTSLVDAIPGISHVQSPALKFPLQAQFHPMKYLKGLCTAIQKYGGKIFTETHATKISEKEVKANDHSITANHVVVATNSPVNDLVTMHTKQHPYRTYVICGLIPKGSIQPALWWDTGNVDSRWVTDPYHYIRIQSFNDTADLLIAGGEDHKTGQADEENIPEENRFTKLIEWTREKFPVMTDVVYRWSGQVLEPVDSLAFIGRNPGDEHVFIATGDSGNGMTHGTIAGMLISDLIQGKENPWEQIYRPSRITLKATGDFLKEVGNMTVQYLDYLAPGDLKTINELAPGQGAVMNLGAKKAAVYRDDHHVLHAFSAICPHLGCVIQWNAAEASFDCPCHGSRFTCQGKVVNGPAQGDLKKIVLN
jgi:glycine/D-amino acid oxidase-like deaminating enzyme/nitrite reductase/ring-hydroxylating ferredoxin subunit